MEPAIAQNAFRAPSAWIPIGLALAAMALLGGYLLTGPHAPYIVIENGVAREDESAVARIWQLLMLAQFPAIAYFAAVWLPKDRNGALRLLALQMIALGAAALPIFVLDM